jgi:hypothetical protein
MKPKSKPPGTMRLKLNCDALLSSFGFKYNLRRYNMGFMIEQFIKERGVLVRGRAVHVEPQ